MWETVIGLEVHVQLKTQSKLFSGAPTCFGAPPNTQTSYIDAALPGVLPLLNAEAIRLALRFGLAIHATINTLSFFERKHYFYPDLPKGYQTTQLKRPMIERGYLEIPTLEGSYKKILISRAHLEEDAGKSMHAIQGNYTGIDLNRAGMPLLEIVTPPCFYSSEDVIAYLKALHQLVCFLDISDGHMQEGSFRCDVNISLRPRGSTTLGTRTEIKNLNSFRFIEKAIAYEQRRHEAILESGETVPQQTRLYCQNTDRTHAMRDKEMEQDYRYLPDPDLLPIEITPAMVEAVQLTMPALPSDIKQRLCETTELLQQDIEFIVSSKALYTYFIAIASVTKAPLHHLIHWLKGPYSAALNSHGYGFETILIKPEQFAILLDQLSSGTISSTRAKILFKALLDGQEMHDAMRITENVVTTEAVEQLIETLIATHSAQAADYQAGKEVLLHFFVGKVMKALTGRADPSLVMTLLKSKLAS